MSQRQDAATGFQIGGALAVVLGIFALVAVIATGGLAWVAIGAVVAGAAVSTVGAGLTTAGVIGTYADEMGTTIHPSIRGATNSANPNGRVPLVLGKHLLTPGYLCPSYSAISGVDGVDEYRYMAFILGYGPLTVSQIQFGETLVATNTANVTNGTIAVDGVLPGCELEIRQDASAGTGLTMIPKEVIQQDFSTALNRFHVLESNKELNGLTITVNASAKTFSRASGDWTAKGTVDTTGYADIQVGDYITWAGFANAGNNILVLVTGVSALTIYCNQATGLVNEAKSGITATVRPSNIQTTAKHTTSISVTITIPKLVKYVGDNKSNATVWVVPYYRLKALPGEAPAAWTILGTFDAGSNSITRNKAENMRFTATSGTLTSGQYEVWVSRENADSTDSKTQDAVYWTALRSHTGIDIMPASYRKKVCILGVKVKASEAVQNCITKLNLKVSADYSYIATADAGHDWASIIASNPQNAALAFVHACMGPGNPRPRTAAQMDWTSIYAFAQWCDTEKGTGANKYRVESNGIITQGMKLSALINQILTPAVASLTMVEGKYGVVWDAAQTVVKQHIGPHNSWNFKASCQRAEAIHGYRIKFVNKDEQYTLDERIVLDDGYKYDTEQDGVLRDAWGVDKTSDGTVIEATKFETIEAALNTNPAQVFGWGRRLLAIRRLRPEVFTVTTDAESLDLKRGELVKVSHPAPAWGLADGRLTAVTVDGGGNITAVTTDNTVTMEAAKAYAVRFRTAAGTSIYKTVTLAVGDTHTLTLDSAIAAGADIPAAGDTFYFGLADLETVDCIVAGIDIDPELNVRLTLFEAAPGVHTADTGAIPAFTSKTSFGPAASMPQAAIPVYPPGQDITSYPATKALTTLSDTVDFNGQYGVFGGSIYSGTMPTTWTRITVKRYADVANDAARNALADMIAGDTVFQTDTRQWYKYTTSWVADGSPQMVPGTVPKHLGRAAFADLATTAGNEGDSIVFYSATIGDCGIYKMVSGTWTDQTTPTTALIMAAWSDILWAVANSYPSTGTASEKVQAYMGSGVNYFETLAANNAFIQNLFVGSASITVTAGTNIVKSFANTDLLPGENAPYTASATYVLPTNSVKKLIFQIGASGTIRTSLTLTHSGADGTAYARVYINGTAVGTERSRTGGASATYTEDFSVSTGDYIAVYLKFVGTAGSSACSSFSLGVAETAGILKVLGTP